MKTPKPILLLATLSLITAALQIANAAVVQKTENFDSEASATANNWRPMGAKTYGSQLGWQPTQLANGTSAGELGGLALNGVGNAYSVWYGDYFGKTNVLRLTNYLSMSGKLNIRMCMNNANAHGPGWFFWSGTNNPSSTALAGGLANNIFRFHFYEPNGGGNGGSRMELNFPTGFPAFTVYTNFQAGNGLNLANQMSVRPEIGSNHTYSINYYPPGSPEAAAAGSANGAILMNWTGPCFDTISNVVVSGFTLGVTLNAAPASTAVFNGFAQFTSDLSDTRPENNDFRFDDLSYTAVTGDPDPHGIVLFDAFKGNNGQVTIGLNGTIGNTNRPMTVIIPQQLNASSDFYLTLTSGSPGTCQPVGAVAGVKTIKFDAGGATTATVPMEYLTLGNTLITAANTNGAPFAATNAVYALTLKAFEDPQTTTNRSQTFDSSAAAAAAGWGEIGSRVNGQNYGFSATANAGGAASGEAGGTFKRDVLRSAYAHYFAAPLTMNEPLSASGRFKCTTWSPVNTYPARNVASQAAFIIGHTDSGQNGLASRLNEIGIRVEFNRNFNWMPHIRDGANTEKEQRSCITTNMGAPVGPVSASWSYVYDPTGGAWGNGRLTVNWSNDNSGVTVTRFIEIPYSQRTNTLTQFDGFGLTSYGNNGTAEEYSTAHIDDVTYTALLGTPCRVRMGANAALASVGATNVTVQVTVPPSVLVAGSASVDIKSTNLTVAVPQGADINGKLTINFPMGGSAVADVPINVLVAGTGGFILTNEVGVCRSNKDSFLVLTAVQGGVTSTKMEPFTTTNSAYADGWREVGSRTNDAGFIQDYGFTDSANAGGPNGEAGGTITRRAVRNYYADRSSIKGLTLNDYISASGTLFITQPATNATWHIAHFNSTDAAATGGRNILGLSIADGSGNLGSPRIFGAVGLANAGGNPSQEIAGLARLFLSDLTTWSYTYDPNAGSFKAGQLVVTYTTFQGTFTITVNLTAQDRLTGASFDSFGILVRGSGNAVTNDAMIAYIDELNYTVGGGVSIQKIEPAPVNQLKITFNSAGTTHKVIQSATASPTSWSDVSGVTFGGPSGLTWTATFANPGTATMFYRVVANPSP